MASMGIFIVIGAIIASMIVAMYTYYEYQPNLVTAKAGEPVIVGPVEYTISFEGTHEGNKDTKPENTFVKIRINAKNISDEKTRMSGGQFYLVDEKQQKHQAVYGKFSSEDLLEDWIEPGKKASWTTQFDVPYDEEKRFSVTVKPTKQQSTVDVANVCIANC
jgi:hypothetical protein